MQFGGHSLFSPLRRVIVKTPSEAFRSEDQIRNQWRALRYLDPPDLQAAIEEHRRFTDLLRKFSIDVLFLPSDDRTGLDSIYCRDAGLITNRGAILFCTGKEARRGESAALREALQKWDVPILGRIDFPATIEGGDLFWLDEKTLIAGHSFRTNAAGISALRSLVSPLGIEVVSVDLPYAHGRDEVLHTMSFVSLIDHNLAVVYRPLMPVPLFELMESRGFAFLDIAEEEYNTMACNVLAIAPRHVIVLAGNPVTRRHLENAGCTVEEYEGREISMKGSGGPTCLTLPLFCDPRAPER